MFLEQLVDILMWWLLWLLPEIRCPSTYHHNDHHNFEYKEFPDTVTPENDDETEDLFYAARPESYEMFTNASEEFRSSWFLPQKPERGPLLPCMARSLPTCITIILSSIGISGIAGFVIYLDMETTDKCIGIESHLNNTSIPSEVLKWKLIGESFEALLLNFWCAATIALLSVNGKEFLRKFKSLLSIGLIMGLLAVICKAYLFIYLGSNFQDPKYRYPGNAIFFFGFILSCIKFANVTKQSTKSIVLKIGQVFIFALFMYVVYRNVIVPWFNEQTNEINKAMIAAILPIFSLIPVAVGKYVVLCHCAGFVQPEVSFVLIYFNYLGPVFLYRIMQAELTDLTLFVAFSLLHGLFNLIAQVRVHINKLF